MKLTTVDQAVFCCCCAIQFSNFQKNSLACPVHPTSNRTYLLFVALFVSIVYPERFGWGSFSAKQTVWKLGVRNSGPQHSRRIVLNRIEVSWCHSHLYFVVSWPHVHHLSLLNKYFLWIRSQVVGGGFLKVSSLIVSAHRAFLGAYPSTSLHRHISFDFCAGQLDDSYWLLVQVVLTPWCRFTKPCFCISDISDDPFSSADFDLEQPIGAVTWFDSDVLRQSEVSIGENGEGDGQHSTSVLEDAIFHKAAPAARNNTFNNTFVNSVGPDHVAQSGTQLNELAFDMWRRQNRARSLRLPWDKNISARVFGCNWAQNYEATYLSDLSQIGSSLALGPFIYINFCGVINPAPEQRVCKEALASAFNDQVRGPS